jgi:radical SAM protein with 4Fe4S-binding SPASM domain
VVENVRAFAQAWLAQPEESRPKHVILSFIDMPRLAPDTAQAEAFWRQIVPQEWVLSKKPLNVWGDQDDPVVARILRDVGVPASGQRALRGRGCHEFSRGFTVLHDGRCVPCCNDYEGRLVLGDLTRQTLAEVWNGTLLQRLRQDETLDNDLCRHCPQYQTKRQHATLPLSPFQVLEELKCYVQRDL